MNDTAPTYNYYMESPVGSILVVTNNKAVTNINFTQKMAENLDQKAYPQIMLSAVHQLSQYFKGTLKQFTVNLEQQATPFRMSVYSELIKIPYGEVISYKELAARIGKPLAVRAVGGANHHNQIAIMVPCHRVIGADGSLTGYGAGVPIKKYLLELEGVSVQ